MGTGQAASFSKVVTSKCGSQAERNRGYGSCRPASSLYELSSLISINELIEDILWEVAEAERRRNRVLGPCQHCQRPLRVDPDMKGWALCGNCQKRPGHKPEERLLRAIFGDEHPCGRCRENAPPGEGDA